MTPEVGTLLPCGLQTWLGPRSEWTSRKKEIFPEPSAALLPRSGSKDSDSERKHGTWRGFSLPIMIFGTMYLWTTTASSAVMKMIASSFTDGILGNCLSRIAVVGIYKQYELAEPSFQSLFSLSLSLAEGIKKKSDLLHRLSAFGFRRLVEVEVLYTNTGRICRNASLIFVCCFLFGAELGTTQLMGLVGQAMSCREVANGARRREEGPHHSLANRSRFANVMMRMDGSKSLDYLTLLCTFEICPFMAVYRGTSISQPCDLASN